MEFTFTVAEHVVVINISAKHVSFHMCVQYRKHAKELVDWICDYYANVEQHPVRSEVDAGYLRPLLPLSAPESPESFQAIMNDLQQKIMPGTAKKHTFPMLQPCWITLKVVPGIR
jgi:hypothetical protein